jgi:hypothetical protein
MSSLSMTPTLWDAFGGANPYGGIGGSTASSMPVGGSTASSMPVGGSTASSMPIRQDFHSKKEWKRARKAFNKQQKSRQGLHESMFWRNDQFPMLGGPGSSARSHSREDMAANHPGFNPQPIRFNPNDPSQTLTDVLAREEQRYNYFYRPVEDELIASLRDTSIIDNARENANAGFGQAAERAARQRSRYGVQQSALEEQQSAAQQAMQQALNFDSTVNDARLEQQERNDGLRRQLIDVGRGFAGDAMSGLSSAAGNQAQRDAANAAARAQHKAQNIGTVGTIASAALMAFLI